MGDLVRMRRWKERVLGFGADTCMYWNRGAVRDINGGAGVGIKRRWNGFGDWPAAAVKRRRGRKRSSNGKPAPCEWRVVGLP